ncbi:hypothetical protein BKA56DRAFT_608663 [Ilyonectria sp. MPI-CAGE-AT-0026]|nr:hypothetical protein BKA56DRAFT_608663 [Ilyonectria sp. MPI-CAGE-AT-0026]
MTDTVPQEFSSQYTNANLPSNATPYDSTILCNLATMLCAQRRGDAVPKLFRDLIENMDNGQIKTLFLSFRHAINLTWPFVGLPHCIPACLGLVNELQLRNITVTSQLDRPLLHESDWLSKGKETNQAIYRAVGNAEVGQMMGEFFPELSYIATAAVFGFLIGGSDKVQLLPLSEVIIAGAIAAMGATRQAKSHFKGSMGLGISLMAMKEVLNVAEQVAAWNGKKLPGEIDLASLAEEARANLERLETKSY